jgi:hypothetical protein
MALHDTPPQQIDKLPQQRAAYDGLGEARTYDKHTYMCRKNTSIRTGGISSAEAAAEVALQRMSTHRRNTQDASQGDNGSQQKHERGLASDKQVVNKYSLSVANTPCMHACM